MDLIKIWTEELPSDWRWTPTNYLGGTPEFIVNTAECMAREVDVVVYYDGQPMIHNDVYYSPRKSFTEGDVILSCNDKAPGRGDYNIYWSNWNHQRQENCLEFDERIVLSPYHQSIFGEDSRIVPHSLWPDQFTNPVKKKKQCLYSSSPDRGGGFLKHIWSEVEERTGAELITTYDKGITDAQMVELYKESEFWLHPGQGVELFCIAAAKAQVAECVPIVVPNMALDTTVKYGVRSTLQAYKEDLIKAINNPPKVENVDFGTWETVTKELFTNV